MNQRIPAQLIFNKVAPQGFPTLYKEWQLDPLSSNKQISHDGVVRFLFNNLSKGVFDPYRSYIELTVQTNQHDLPVGLLQVDNSAQSFILQTVLTSNSRQVQRIRNYSTLAAYMMDVGMTEVAAQGRQTQGFGYCSFDTMPYSRSMNGVISSNRRQDNSGDTSLTYSIGNIFPTIGNAYPQQVRYTWANSLFNCSKQAKGHVTNSNPSMTFDWNGGDQDKYKQQIAYQTSMKYTGYSNNIRAQYLTSFISSKYVQSPQSVPCYQLCLDSSLSPPDKDGKYKFPFYFNQSAPKPYKTIVRNNYTEGLVFSNSQQNVNTHDINCANFGFSNLFSPHFSKGTFQPFVSPTVPQTMIDNGFIAKTKSPVASRTFKIPLISGIIGILIPRNQYSLLPLEAIKDLLLQVSLDRFAMFSSGYSDYCQYDTQGINYQIPRNYTITRVSYKLHTYQFEGALNKHVQTAMFKQIAFNTFLWGLGNQYQIPGGQRPNNTYQVGAIVDALNQLLLLVQLNDNQKWTFCRKHFRASLNIEKLYARIGMDYRPPQPYRGKAGVQASGDLYGDNSIFVNNLYWNNDYYIKTAQTIPRINIYNFTPNDRSYNPGNKMTFYDTSMKQNHDYTFTSRSVNADTGMGMSWIHQNRYVGRAAFLIPMDPFYYQEEFLTGVNTRGVSNLQVVIEAGGNPCPRDSTLYIFYKSTNVVLMTKKGIFLTAKS